MLARDRGRFRDCRARADELPLGAGALAGTGFPIDRRRVARELGFRRVSANSVDAVSDRDGAVEFLAAAAITAVHLSRLAEDIVLWATEEFGFVELPDAFATGSSMMPQKKNPDVAELVRGKTGRTIGALVALLTVLKGLPLAYNRDLQEDKEPLFDSVATVLTMVPALAGAVRTLRFDADAMARAAGDGLLLALHIGTKRGDGPPRDTEFQRVAPDLGDGSVRRGTEIDREAAEQSGPPKASNPDKESETSLQQHAHLVLLRSVASIDEHGEKKSGGGAW